MTRTQLDLFILFQRQRRSSQRDIWPKNEESQQPALGRTAQTKGIRRPPQCAVRKSRGQEYPLTKEKEGTTEREANYPAPWALSSLNSQTTHSSILAARALSSSVPSATVCKFQELYKPLLPPGIG